MMRLEMTHSALQYNEQPVFLKQQAAFIFRNRKLVQGHAWFPYVTLPLHVPEVGPIPLGALLELAGDSCEEFCRLCDDTAWLEQGLSREDMQATARSDQKPVKAPQTSVKERIQMLATLCEAYRHQPVTMPAMSDLREVVASLRRTGRLAYLTDDQLMQLRSHLHAFDVYDSLDELETYLIDTFVEEMISSCREGACVTLRPEYFRYYWSRVPTPGHFTARYSRNRNVCIFPETTNLIDSVWSLRRAQEEYLEALYVSRFEWICNAVETAVKDNRDISIEGCNHATQTLSLVHSASKELPVLTLWEVMECQLQENPDWIAMTLDDHQECMTDEEFELIRSNREDTQRQRIKDLLPSQVDIMERIINGIASDDDFAQCVELCNRIVWGN